MEVAGIVGVVGSIAVVLSVTRTYITLLRQFTEPNDTRLLSLEAKLFSEDGRLTQWMEYMNVRTWDDLEVVILEKDRAMVKRLWVNINSLLQDAKRFMERLDLSKGKVVNRLRWSVGGEYEKLKSLMEAIRDLNEALYTVARPPPRYTPAAEPGSLFYGSPVRQSSVIRVSPRVQENGSQEVHEDEVPDPPQVRRVISLLSRQAVIALGNILGHTDGDDDLEVCFTRLRKWPGTFLEGELALDLLLSHKESGVTTYASMKDALITTFVDILLIEGKSSTSIL